MAVDSNFDLIEQPKEISSLWFYCMGLDIVSIYFDFDLKQPTES